MLRIHSAIRSDPPRALFSLENVHVRAQKRSSFPVFPSSRPPTRAAAQCVQHAAGAVPKAKKKPLEKVAVDTLFEGPSPLATSELRLKTIRVEDPPTRAGGVKVGDVDELLSKLKNEAKVL